MDFKPHIHCREDYSCCWAVKWVTRRINPSSGALVIKHPPCWAPCGGKNTSIKRSLITTLLSMLRLLRPAPPNHNSYDDPKPELCGDKYTLCDVICCAGERRVFAAVRCWLDCLFVGSQDWCGSGPAFRTESVKLTLMGVNFYKHRHSTNLHTLTWMNHYGFTASESRLNPTLLISVSFPHVRTESVSCSLSLRQGSDPVWTNTWNLCHFFYKKMC